MLIDLARNDIGRIAKTGSVKVTEAFAVERYSHVMHIVSNVEGLLQDGMTNLDVLKRDLPRRHADRRAEGARDGDHRRARAGQARHLRRRLRLPQLRRRHGRRDRDPHRHRQGRHAHVQASAGVVADSVAELEWQETEAKARALLRAAELVEEGF